MLLSPIAKITLLAIVTDSYQHLLSSSIFLDLCHVNGQNLLWTTSFVFFVDTQVCGFELVSLQVYPERPRVGDDVHLQCFYQLDQGELLYSLKWNKKDSNDEDKEFYRFSSRRPVKQKFSLADLDIDVSKIHTPPVHYLYDGKGHGI